MSPGVNMVCTFVLTHGLMMSLAARELWLLRRDPPGGGGEDERDEAPRAPKPLPDCLIPKLGPLPPDWQRQDERELELV